MLVSRMTCRLNLNNTFVVKGGGSKPFLLVGQTWSPSSDCESLLSSQRTVEPGVPQYTTRSTRLVMPAQTAPGECRHRYRYGVVKGPAKSPLVRLNRPKQRLLIYELISICKKTETVPNSKIVYPRFSPFVLPEHKADRLTPDFLRFVVWGFLVCNCCCCCRCISLSFCCAMYIHVYNKKFHVHCRNSGWGFTRSCLNLLRQNLVCSLICRVPI